MADAGKTLSSNNVPVEFMLFTMWLDGMKHISEHSKGNILSFDGSQDGFEKTMKQMQGLKMARENKNGNT